MSSKIKAFLIGIGIVIVLVLVCMIQHRRISAQKEEIERLNHNVGVLIADAKVQFIRDSLRSVEVGTMIMDLQDMRDLRAQDAALIKDLQIRLKDARGVTHVKTEYRDTVLLRVDTIRSVPTLRYEDSWVDVDFNPSDSTLTYMFKDSISTVLHIRYRKKFLWWRWKPEYKVSSVSHNPHCTLLQTESVMID